MSVQSHDNTGGDTASRLRTLVLGAIGVVYGDIGTSPLYTIRQTFGEHGVAATPGNVLGVLSLVFWSLILVVSVKYAGFIMRADNKGEGGIMALTALAQRSVRSSRRGRWWIVMLGLFGASLFFGDGVITPAISVLGAVEGLEVLAPRLEHWVVPISAIIIVALFAVQNRGTGRVGLVFAPVMILWFAALAALGIWHVAQNPGVLRALSPHYAIEFFLHAKWSAFFALGSVILAITGAEALYADMGHFGKKPIRWSWFGFVLPALVLNYFGQGALLIADPKTAENPLYLMVPQSMLVPMLLLATAAAVIASQAVISGAFSVTREAIQLGFLPRMQVRHTSDEQIGQVYLPWINRMLMIMTLAVVLGFRSSDNLGAAYGIAVVGTMTIDSVLVMIVFRRLWNWSRARVLVVGLLFLFVTSPSSPRTRTRWSMAAGSRSCSAASSSSSCRRGAAARNSSCTRSSRAASRSSRSSPQSSRIRRCACRARRSSLPRTRTPCRTRCCTTSSTTRCCTSATSCSPWKPSTRQWPSRPNACPCSRSATISSR
jgi:KUP system potassium uptake protein